MVLMVKFIGSFLLLIVFITSCEEAPGINSQEQKETEEAAVLDQFLTISDQADNYTDLDLPAFFNLQPNAE